MNSTQNDENLSPTTSTTTIPTKISKSTTSNIFSLSSDQTPKQNLINSFLNSVQVQTFYHEYLHKWSDIHRKQQQTHDAVEKLTQHITSKTIPKSMQIKIKINLPQECNESVSNINLLISETNNKILQLVFDSRKVHLQKLTDSLKSFVPTTKSTFTEYLKIQSQSITSLPDSDSFPSKEIIDHFINSLRYAIATKEMNTIYLKEEEKRKKQKQKEEDALAEEKVKTNKEKTVKALIEIEVEKKLKKRKLENTIASNINQQQDDQKSYNINTYKKQKSISTNKNIKNNFNTHLNKNSSNKFQQQYYNSNKQFSDTNSSERFQNTSHESEVSSRKFHSKPNSSSNHPNSYSKNELGEKRNFKQAHLIQPTRRHLKIVKKIHHS